MSLFDENIRESSCITAKGLYDLHNQLKKEFGHSDSGFMYGRGDFQNFDQIPEEKIDAVIDDILSYIYYNVKLGLDNHQLNKFEQGIPAEIFGVTPYNRDSEQVTELLNKITKKFKARGFDVWLLYNDNILKIQWYNVIEMKPNMVI